jgi:hypothetical protein
MGEMIDSLSLRIPRHVRFSSRFGALYRELRGSENDPFHAGKYYEFAGDLREHSLSCRLNLFCQMDKVGNHKIELIDVGIMDRATIIREVCEVFDVDPLSLEVMRVDFAVDIPDLPLQWFREVVRVAYKRWRAALTTDPFYGEMGNGDIQTLYFGKRPNLIRIYNKLAEYVEAHKKLLRKLSKDCERPSLESIFPAAAQHSILTRVERQIGGRIPAQIHTLRDVFENSCDFTPFASLKIIDHTSARQKMPGTSFETHCTGLFLRGLAEGDGMQALETFIKRNSNGNSAWARKKYQGYLPSACQGHGITEAELQVRFEQSLARQFS